MRIDYYLSRKGTVVSDRYPLSPFAQLLSMLEVTVNASLRLISACFIARIRSLKSRRWRSSSNLRLKADLWLHLSACSLRLSRSLFWLMSGLNIQNRVLSCAFRLNSALQNTTVGKPTTLIFFVLWPPSFVLSVMSQTSCFSSWLNMLRSTWRTRSCG